MGTSWVGALWRAATALGRGRRVTEGEDLDTDDEAGFTLIELMVVLLIMGILMAIAIPTFLGVTNTANDRSTQSNLTNAMTASKAIYAQADTYTVTTGTATAGAASMVARLTKDEPEMTYTVGASTTQHLISVAVSTKGTVLDLAAFMQKTKVCWQAQDKASGTNAGITYTYSTAATCTAAKFATGVGTQKWPTPPAGK